LINEKEDLMDNENKVAAKSATMNPELLQLIAGNEAMYAIFKKYFAVIIGSLQSLYRSQK